MTIEEVREFAGVHGILSLEKFENKEDLIKTIQLAMGRNDCFGEEERCQNGYCEWKEECRMNLIYSEV
jgi:hypothetical protein